jgi:hypothetical protein
MDTSAGAPISTSLKTALATVSKPSNNGDTATVTDPNAKCFPEDRMSKDYYFDSYAHL